MATDRLFTHSYFLLGYVHIMPSMLRAKQESLGHCAVSGLLGHRHSFPWQLLPLHIVQVCLWCLYYLALHLCKLHLRYDTHMHVGDRVEKLYDS